MATIIRETLITTDLASSWDALSDFGALHTRLAAGFVLDTQLERPDERPGPAPDRWQIREPRSERRLVVDRALLPAGRLVRSSMSCSGAGVVGRRR